MMAVMLMVMISGDDDDDDFKLDLNRTAIYFILNTPNPYPFNAPCIPILH